MKKKKKTNVDKFIDQLIDFHNKYKDIVEPSDGPQLRSEDQETLVKDNNFKKVVASAVILNLLGRDEVGGYWPMTEILYNKVNKDIEKFIDLYEVTFTKDLQGQYQPSVKLRDEE